MMYDMMPFALSVMENSGWLVLIIFIYQQNLQYLCTLAKLR
jgi:hypothetical protein